MICRLHRYQVIVMGLCMSALLPLRAALLWCADFESYSSGEEVTLSGDGTVDTFTSFDGSSSVLVPVLTTVDGGGYGLTNGLCVKWTSSEWSSSKAMMLNQVSVAACSNASVLVLSFDRVRPSGSTGGSNALGAFKDIYGTRIRNNVYVLDDEIGAGVPCRITLVMNRSGSGIALPGSLGTLGDGQYTIYAKKTDGSYLAGTVLDMFSANPVGGFVLQQLQSTAGAYQLFDNLSLWNSLTNSAGQSVLEFNFGSTLSGAETGDLQIQKLTLEYPGPGYTAQQREAVWINSTAGTADVVLPPWTPVQLDGLNVSVWNRIYELGDSGLPSNIVTATRSLLKMPMRYVLRTGSGTFSGAYTNQVLEQKDTAVCILFSAVSDGVEARTTVTIEYDGLCRFETELIPTGAGAVVEEFSLDIPLSAENLEYYNHGTLGTYPFQKKDNPDLYILSNNGNGRIGTETLTFPWTLQMTLLGRETGLCIGFNDERDWHSPADEMIELIPQGDTVTFRAKMISSPVNLAETLNYRWYLQALPARPQLPWNELKAFHNHQEADAKGYNSHFIETNGHALIDDAIDVGLQMIVMHQGWTELQGYPGTFDTQLDQYLRTTIANAHAKGLKAVLYLGLEVSTACPEWDEYASKMVKLPLWMGRERTSPAAAAPRPCSNRYYNDMLVHRLHDLINEYDIDGVFLDGHPTLGLCMNTSHGHGYTKPDGTWAGTSYALESRDLMRRIYSLFHDEVKTNGVVIGHGGLYTSSFAFMDVNLAGETEVYARAVNPALKLNDLMSLDYFGALYNQDVFGTRLLWMSKPDKGGFTYDQNMAATFAYGVLPRVFYPELDAPAPAALQALKNETRDMPRSHEVWNILDRFGLSNAVHIPFWEIESYCKVSPELSDTLAVSMYWAEGDRALLEVSNLSAEDVQVTLQPQNQSLRFGANVQIWNPEAADLPETLSGGVDLNVPAGNYVLVILENISGSSGFLFRIIGRPAD